MHLDKGDLMPEEWRDFYADLGVSYEATRDEIADKYRELVKKYHPDAGGGKAGEEKFIVVTRAWDVLGNPMARYKYDETYKIEKRDYERRHNGHHTTAPPPPPPKQEPPRQQRHETYEEGRRREEEEERRWQEEAHKKKFQDQEDRQRHRREQEQRRREEEEARANREAAERRRQRAAEEERRKRERDEYERQREEETLRREQARSQRDAEERRREQERLRQEPPQQTRVAPEPEPSPFVEPGKLSRWWNANWEIENKGSYVFKWALLAVIPIQQAILGFFLMPIQDSLNPDYAALFLAGKPEPKGMANGDKFMFLYFLAGFFGVVIARSICVFFPSRKKRMLVFLIAYYAVTLPLTAVLYNKFV